MRRVTVELDEADYEYLRERARREHTSVVAVLREAVARLRRADVLGSASDPMYQVGSFDGPADLAERHDASLYGDR